MEVVGGVSLRPPSARIGQLSPVDVGGRFLLRAAPRRQPTARRVLVVEARGRNWSERQMQQQRRMPQLPKIEDDGNPRFVIFIRTANVRVVCSKLMATVSIPPLHSSFRSQLVFLQQIQWRVTKICAFR
jgi:hypothetical protein